MLDRFKQSREVAATAKARSAAEYQLSDLALQANLAYESYLAAQLEHSESRLQGVQLKMGEIAYLVLDGVGLVEPRRAPTQWVGGSHGVSFNIAKGVRYRVGQTRGHVVQGEERPTIIDTGLGVVTNRRMLFIGAKRSTEWAYSKLLGYSLEHDSMAIFNVTNRQKASGFAYQTAVDHRVDAIVTAALAAFQGPEEHAEVLEAYKEAYLEVQQRWAALNTQLNPVRLNELPPPQITL